VIIDPSDDYGTDERLNLNIPEISLDEAIEEALTDPSEFTWRLVPDFDRDYEDIFKFCISLYNCFVVSEEVSDYSGNEHYRRLSRRGRSRGIKVISVAQRPAEVHKTICSMSALCIAFYTSEPRDLAYIEEKFGSEARKEVESLDPESFECAVWGDMKIWDQYFDNEAPFPSLHPIQREDGEQHGNRAENA
jgi:hypothetical protein